MASEQIRRSPKFVRSADGGAPEFYSPQMAVRWPLTGRSDEMRHIEAVFAAPGLSGIVVSGQAGVGKSRIAREALALAASKGCVTRWAVGTSSARSVPLGAFAEWTQPGATSTVALVRAVIDALTPEHTDVVLGVDDVHLLDDLSTFVLHQIVQRGRAKVVLTVRDNEPMSAGVQEIWHDGQFERLELQPLTREQTLTLLAATLEGPVDPDAAERLWRLTRGNALYLHNIVEHWRWSGDPAVPADLVETIESRIGALPDPVNDVIDALAVAEPLQLSSLQRITDADAVEQADTRGLISLGPVDGGIEVRLAHPLYGEVRRRRAPPTRLRRLRALVANDLASTDPGDDMRVVVRRASLSLDSDLEPDAELLLDAAQGAVWLADLPLAERLASAAIRAGGATEAYFVSAHALSWLGRGADADAALLAIPDSEVDDAGRGRIAFLRSANMLCAMADPARARATTDDASRIAPDGARECIDAFLTVHSAAIGEPLTAIATSEALAGMQLPAVVGAVTAWATTLAHGDAGHTAKALAAAEGGDAIASGAFDAAQMRFVIADARVGALLLAGCTTDAVDAAQGLRRQAADFPGAAQLLSTALAGRAALGAGQLATATSLLEPVVELLFAAGDTNGFGYQYHLPRTVALAMRGLATEAAAALKTLEARRYPSWRYLDYSYAIAQAWVSACQGAVSEAIDIVVDAARSARARGQYAAEVLCWQTATQFGDSSGAPRLHELAATVEGPRAAVVERFAFALRDGDGAGLAAASDAFEAIGDLVAATDAAAYASLAHHKCSRRGSALACSARAEALAKRSGAHTPALRQAIEPLPLTAREREIVMLLGEGLSSRLVAERLTLSIRTVESHIYKAMAKTGTTTRDELAALIPRKSST